MKLLQRWSILLLLFFTSISPGDRPLAGIKPPLVFITISKVSDDFTAQEEKQRGTLRSCGFDVKDLSVQSAGGIKEKLRNGEYPAETVSLISAHGKVIKEQYIFDPDGYNAPGKEVLKSIRECIPSGNIYVESCHSGACFECLNQKLGVACRASESSKIENEVTDLILSLLCDSINHCSKIRDLDKNRDGKVTGTEINEYFVAKYGNTKPFDVSSGDNSASYSKDLAADLGRAFQECNAKKQFFYFDTYSEFSFSQTENGTSSTEKAWVKMSGSGKPPSSLNRKLSSDDLSLENAFHYVARYNYDNMSVSNIDKKEKKATLVSADGKSKVELIYDGGEAPIQSFYYRCALETKVAAVRNLHLEKENSDRSERSKLESFSQYPYFDPTFSLTCHKPPKSPAPRTGLWFRSRDKMSDEDLHH